MIGVFAGKVIQLSQIDSQSIDLLTNHLSSHTLSVDTQSRKPVTPQI